MQTIFPTGCHGSPFFIAKALDKSERFVYNI